LVFNLIIVYNFSQFIPRNCFSYIRQSVSSSTVAPAQPQRGYGMLFLLDGTADGPPEPPRPRVLPRGCRGRRPGCACCSEISSGGFPSFPSFYLTRVIRLSFLQPIYIRHLIFFNEILLDEMGGKHGLFGILVLFFTQNGSLNFWHGGLGATSSSRPATSSLSVRRAC